MAPKPGAGRVGRRPRAGAGPQQGRVQRAALLRGLAGLPERLRRIGPAGASGCGVHRASELHHGVPGGDTGGPPCRRSPGRGSGLRDGADPSRGAVPEPLLGGPPRHRGRRRSERPSHRREPGAGPRGRAGGGGAGDRPSPRHPPRGRPQLRLRARHRRRRGPGVAHLHRLRRRWPRRTRRLRLPGSRPGPPHSVDSLLLPLADSECVLRLAARTGRAGSRGRRPPRLLGERPGHARHPRRGDR